MSAFYREEAGIHAYLMNRLAHKVHKLLSFLMLGDTSCIAAPTSRAFATDQCPVSALARNFGKAAHAARAVPANVRCYNMVSFWKVAHAIGACAAFATQSTIQSIHAFMH